MNKLNLSFSDIFNFILPVGFGAFLIIRSGIRLMNTGVFSFEGVYGGFITASFDFQVMILGLLLVMFAITLWKVEKIIKLLKNKVE